jgi:hypothetical protein
VLRAAKNTLVDLGHDISRNLDTDYALRQAGISIPRDSLRSAQDLHDAFWDGLHDVLGRKTVQSWLADEILFRAREARGEA